MNPEESLNVFVSYARRDETLRRELDAHLALLKRQDVIRTWYDGEISPGEEWEGAITRNLDTADVVLLLISPDFIDSDFCWSREMKRAMQRHDDGEARVIPILLRPVHGWENAPFGKLGVLPKDGRAVTEWPDLDVAFRDVAAGISTAVEEASRRPSASAAENALRVVMLIGHSLDDPLPAAAEMAKTSALELRDSGLAIELRVDQATTANLEREARLGCDLLIYYGHGTADGELSFADGRHRFADLAGSVPAEFWNRLGACFLFACYGDRFAAELPCPWVAFAAPILTQAPKGFVHALIPALKDVDLAGAVGRARELCATAMSSSFTDVMRFSEAALPPLEAPPGVARLSRLSPALANRHRLDFGSLRDEDHLYPDHDPFVGRRADLENLLSLPSPYDDRPLQRVVWVHGDAGMGKSALLRQFATQVRDLVFHELEEPVYLLHLHCYKHTEREHVVEALGARAQELYELDKTPGSLEELFAVLESRFGTQGTHVWILDDLTYLSTRPDSTEEAARLVFGLRDLAHDRVLRWQLTVSSRRTGPKIFEEVCLAQLSTAEARELAVRVWLMSRREPSDEVVLGAVQLFRLIRSTAQFKRALMLAIERGTSYLKRA